MADIKTQTDTVLLEPGTASHHFLLHLPPPYPPPYISPQHCPSPPPAYTLLHHSCSCGGRREHKRRRLVTVLSLMIMILLSITMGVAWKHWELVTEVKDDEIVEKSYDSKFTLDKNVTHFTIFKLCW